MSVNHNTRTVEWFQQRGWVCAIVERWNAFSQTRHDLWGFDALAFTPRFQGVTGIQLTSRANMRAREKKLVELSTTERWLEAGNRILVVGWWKFTGPGRLRWYPRIRELTATGPREIYDFFPKAGVEFCEPVWEQAIWAPEGRLLPLTLRKKGRR